MIKNQIQNPMSINFDLRVCIKTSSFFYFRAIFYETLQKLFAFNRINVGKHLFDFFFEFLFVFLFSLSY